MQESLKKEVIEKLPKGEAGILFKTGNTKGTKSGESGKKSKQVKLKLQKV